MNNFISKNPAFIFGAIIIVAALFGAALGTSRGDLLGARYGAQPRTDQGTVNGVIAGHELCPGKHVVQFRGVLTSHQQVKAEQEFYVQGNRNYRNCDTPDIDPVRGNRDLLDSGGTYGIPAP